MPQNILLLPSAIFTQFLWFNLNIKINNKSIFIPGFASKNINFVCQIFHKNGKAKSWDYIKSEYNLQSKLKYHWIQLTDALLKLWKDCILSCIENSMNLCIFDHDLIKKSNLYCLNKLRSRELYQIQIKIQKTAVALWRMFQQIWFRLEVSISFTTYGNCRYKIKSFSVQNTKQNSFCE